jgi:hypothetical protein
MPIYRLTPIDSEHRDWDSSTHRSATTIRAPNEKAARYAATLAFRIATKVTPGKTVPDNPWRSSSSSSISILEDQKWPSEGPVEILEPTNHNEALDGVNWDAIK